MREQEPRKNYRKTYREEEGIKPVDCPETLEETMGSETGEAERSTVAGGWAGTDDATSTAPSDLLANPPLPEDEKRVDEIQKDIEEAIERDEEESIL